MNLVITRTATVLALLFSLIFGACGNEAPPAPTEPGSPSVLDLSLQECPTVGTESEAVLPGVTLTFDGSFLCADAPDQDSYAFTVRIQNGPESAEAVRIEDAVLSKTTPRPRGQAPDGSLDGVDGLPLTLEPGESGTFTVRGNYELVQTDEGEKANLHFAARGTGLESGDAFSFHFNAHFRAPGVAAE
ncbi:MAG: hypothetical protein ACREMD_09700 [Gemmatimonadota bacterium]